MLISGSAAGYYGDLGEVVVTEEPPHNGVYPQALRPLGADCPAKRRRSHPPYALRTEVVLAREAAFWQNGASAFKLGLPAALSAAADSIWLDHIDDMVNGIPVAA